MKGLPQNQAQNRAFCLTSGVGRLIGCGQFCPVIGRSSGCTRDAFPILLIYTSAILGKAQQYMHWNTDMQVKALGFLDAGNRVFNAALGTIQIQSTSSRIHGMLPTIDFVQFLRLDCVTGLEEAGVDDDALPSITTSYIWMIPR